MPSEVKWSCGCYEIDGKLVQQCTQVAPQGNISADQHATNKPFAAKCARLAYERDKALATPAPVPVAVSEGNDGE